MAEKDKTPQERLEAAADETKVKAIQAEELGLANILRLKLQIREADKQSEKINNTIAKLSAEQVKNIEKYQQHEEDLKAALKDVEKKQAEIQTLTGRQRRNAMIALQDLQAEVAGHKERKATLEKTAGVALYNKKREADITATGLKTERALIKKINEERGIGGKIMDLFRTKERKQLDIDIARAKVGGGNQAGKTGGGAGEVDTTAALAAAGPYGRLAAAIKKGIDQLSAPVKELGNQLKNAIVAPFASAANLLTGDSFGMGGGKANASGATSILGGLSSIASKIPFIGGLLGGLVDGFKSMLDAVLGVDQANFRVARTMNISVKEADNMRASFYKAALASDNIVVNSTRMLQSQVEIGNQLGINKQLSDDILINDVKLRDILGLEAESRKAISDQAIVTGRQADELTKSAIGTVGAFNKLVGTSFKWSSILGEASKLTGVLGLTLTKFPEKIYNAVLATKTLGFELSQLDKVASSFLDFESSISAEMEAQVLTGKDMNLTLARQAALNNENATLAEEITKNVGSTAEFLEMDRIRQEAIAKAVGLTRDSLADVLKKQEIYRRAGVTDQEGLVKKLELLQQQGKLQKEISDVLGEDGYKMATQVSTAEKLTEIMERMKEAVVNFVRNSGLFDFLNDPQKLNNFIKNVVDSIAGAVSLVSRVIASVVDLLGTITFGDTSRNFHSLADEIRGKGGKLTSNISAVANSLGGSSTQSITGTVESGARQEGSQRNAQTVPANQQAPIFTFHHVTKLDGQVLTTYNAKETIKTAGIGNGIQ